jgi:triosephosphate isomerase
MNTDLAAAVELATGVRAGLDQDPGAQVILCPPFISLSTVADAVRGSSIQVGAQNMHFQDSGAFTGEIAPSMLRAVCDYVILGHSERRQLFGETDGEINLKVQAAFRHGLQPILCVGETLEEREAGRAGDVVETQLRNGLADLVDIRGLIVAYEPVWAIGTGQAATPEIASEIMGGAVQQTLVSLFADTAGNVPLLYGGSVNPGNVAEFAAQDCIHGALVGGASLQAEQFVEVVKQAVLVKSSG